MLENIKDRISKTEYNSYMSIYELVRKLLKVNLYDNERWGILKGEKVYQGTAHQEYFDVMYDVFYTPCLDKMLFRLRWWWLHRPEYFVVFKDSKEETTLTMIMTWKDVIKLAYPHDEVCSKCNQRIVNKWNEQYKKIGDKK